MAAACSSSFAAAAAAAAAAATADMAAAATAVSFCLFYSGRTLVSLRALLLLLSCIAV